MSTEKETQATEAAAQKKNEALEMALNQIEKSFGKGSVMRRGAN